MSRVFNNPTYDFINNHNVKKNPLYLSADDNIYSTINQTDNNDNIYSEIYEDFSYKKNRDLLRKHLKLPKGWRRLYDPKSKKFYFACKYTKHTQWLDPTIPIDKIMENKLPYYWEEEWDDCEKKYYYINHLDKYTTWIKPNKL